MLRHYDWSNSCCKQRTFLVIPYILEVKKYMEETWITKSMCSQKQQRIKPIKMIQKKLKINQNFYNRNNSSFVSDTT